MEFTIKTTRRKETIDITEQVLEAVQASGVRDGLCHVFTRHATAAIVINENADPNIGVDLLNALDRMIPDHAGWLHDRIDNNAHAHIKASLLGPGETIPIKNGRLHLGTWQAIMFVELDGPRGDRKIHVQVMG